MKADNYTKVIFTVIAVNLTILTVKNMDIIPETYANEPLKSLNGNYGLIPLNSDGSIDVNIKSVNSNLVLDVNIEEVDGHSFFGKLPIEIKDQPIEVEIEDQPIEVKMD